MGLRGEAEVIAARRTVAPEACPSPARTVGVVLEPNAFHPARSGRNHLRVLADATGVRRARVDETLDLVGLDHAAAAVILDVAAVPTLVLAVMAGVSLAVRRDGWSSLGFRRPGTAHLATKMLAFAAGWSLFQLAATMPIANHASGRETDLSQFDNLQGNVGQLVGWIVLSWTLAALVEEFAFRGYLQTRMRQLFGAGTAALDATVLLSSALFGFIHSEQGVVGALTITLDAVAFSVLRYRYKTLWASVFAHGFNNTLGFIAFFVVGPLHGFW